MSQAGEAMNNLVERIKPAIDLVTDALQDSPNEVQEAFEDIVEELESRLAQQAEPFTYTVDGEVMSPLEYISYLHDQLSALQGNAGDQTAEAVNRFLGWQLPKTFAPDCGISFKPVASAWPVGTNLLNAIEAKAMFEYCLRPAVQVPVSGGRESVEDALEIVESFGPGTEGVNDTLARQILLAEEVKRLRAELSATQANQQGKEAEQPKLVLALPDYEKRRIVIASDEVIDGERLVCVAITDATRAADPAPIPMCESCDDPAKIMPNGETAPCQACEDFAADPAQAEQASDEIDAELAPAIEAGTKAWAGTPDNWLEELRGGSDPAPAQQAAGDERQRFEAWAAKHSLWLDRYQDGYLNLNTHTAWLGWKARAAIQLSPVPVGHITEEDLADLNKHGVSRVYASAPRRPNGATIASFALYAASQPSAQSSGITAE